MCSLVNRPNANERLVCPRAHERCPAHGAQLVPSAPQAREKPVVRHQAMNYLSSPSFFEKKIMKMFKIAVAMNYFSAPAQSSAYLF